MTYKMCISPAKNGFYSILTLTLSRQIAPSIKVQICHTTPKSPSRICEFIINTISYQKKPDRSDVAK